ncbi:MAG: winged helix DNA-binding protein [Clostridiales bacterium]|nr:winged helix DNA-binding protein [Clostridiales bacterium]
MEDRYPLMEETIGHLRFFGHFLHYQMGNKFGRRRILKIMLEHMEAEGTTETTPAGTNPAGTGAASGAGCAAGTAAASGGILQRDLQDILHIQSGSLSEVIIKIEAEGLIEKTRSEKDGRQIVLRLTPEGEKLARSYKAEHEEKVRQLMSCLSDEEMRDLNATLARLEQHWKEMETDTFKSSGMND